MPGHSNKIISKIDATTARFEKNMRSLAELVAAVRAEEEQIRQGGGAKAIDAQHAKSRLTARERINLLIDRDTTFSRLACTPRSKCMKSGAERRPPAW
jgi:acetyl-CoA carboxylase carboxyltransferase component